MTKDDILTRDEIDTMWQQALCAAVANGEMFTRYRFSALLEAKVRADERNALLAAFLKLRDESHTILGASDDYKQGREMGIQLCINELTRGEK